MNVASKLCASSSGILFIEPEKIVLHTSFYATHILTHVLQCNTLNNVQGTLTKK